MHIWFIEYHQSCSHRLKTRPRSSQGVAHWSTPNPNNKRGAMPRRKSNQENLGKDNLAPNTSESTTQNQSFSPIQESWLSPHQCSYTKNCIWKVVRLTVNFWKQMENLEHLWFNEDLTKVSVGISEMFPKPESIPCLECWLHNMLGACWATDVYLMLTYENRHPLNILCSQWQIESEALCNSFYHYSIWITTPYLSQLG